MGEDIMKRKDKLLIIVFVLFIIVYFIDAYQTQLLLNIGAEEVNPFLNYCINEFGYNSVYVIKTTMIFFLAIISYFWIKKEM